MVTSVDHTGVEIVPTAVSLVRGRREATHLDPIMK